MPTQNAKAATMNIKIVDIGAAVFDSTEYKFGELIKSGQASLIGFEPDPQECANLRNKFPDTSRYQFHQFALGDGSSQLFNICEHPGRSSLLEPNIDFCSNYVSFAELMNIQKRVKVRTRKLDDVDAVTDVDLLKLDTQGSELAILKGAEQKLSHTLVIDCEVEFVAQYREQPRFSEIEMFLRDRSFQFHSFLGFGTRPLTPYDEETDPRENERKESWLWADALFVRRFEDWPKLSPEKNRKLKTILEEVYSAYDFAERLEHNFNVGAE